MTCKLSQTSRDKKNEVYRKPCSKYMIHKREDGFGMCKCCLDEEFGDTPYIVKAPKNKPKKSLNWRKQG